MSRVNQAPVPNNWGNSLDGTVVDRILGPFS